ncbi:MAG TPA: ATP-binding protein [Ramlibacter sp.]|uniref:PAS domain-containing sensor histidine kinase n=1 Tax=Ramlibacter sp. TaxID=1917967 RepID=UPI002D8092BF|nr:ATP-binding protein [Ramlibacter sp.]HET8746509.1 ATP-binding protein [Ramlibacter sp.]
MPPRPSPLQNLPSGELEGVNEATWLDVIQKMDEVYSRLVDDETELENKNAQLEQSQRFIFSLLAAMSDVLVACSEEGLIEETNPALCELVGASDAQLRGTPVVDLLADEESIERWQLALHHSGSREGAVVELNLRGAAGPVPVDMNCTLRRDSAGRPVGRVLVGRPLGELKRAYRQLRDAHDALKQAQQQLLQSEKMASLGRLVAGVAHELNNPISFVLGNVHVLQRYGDRLTRYLAAVHAQEQPPHLAALRSELRIDRLLADLPSLTEGTLEGAQRTADIVNGLKRFSSGVCEEATRVDLVEVVQRAIHWVRKGTAPQFEVMFEPGAPVHVNGSPGELLQVMMNLIQNAYDAASALDDRVPRLAITCARGEHGVVLRFADNGPGLRPEHLSRLFEPFFTTKPVGKGTGLGLSISYGIVEKHGGRLEAENAAEGGAVFSVTLPLSA